MGKDDSVMYIAYKHSLVLFIYIFIFLFFLRNTLYYSYWDKNILGTLANQTGPNKFSIKR